MCVSGLFPSQHPAEHQLQDVREERELFDHADEPQSVPALPLQEMPLSWHVERRWDILTHFHRERDPGTALPERHSALISPSSRDMGSPKEAQHWYVGLREKCNAESLLRSWCHWLSHSLHQQTCASLALPLLPKITIWPRTALLSFRVSFFCPLQHPPTTLLPLCSHSEQRRPPPCAHHVPTAPLHLPLRQWFMRRGALKSPKLSII